MNLQLNAMFKEEVIKANRTIMIPMGPDLMKMII